MREPRWSEITAVLGGAFDPPHRGHLEAAKGLFLHPGAQRVWFMPTGKPVLKRRSPLEAQERLHMTRLLVDDLLTENPELQGRISVRDDEVVSAQVTGEPTYTVESAARLAQELGTLGATQLAWVIGTDQVAQMHRWHRFPEVLGACHWIVLDRADGEPAKALQSLQEWCGSGLARNMGDHKWALFPRGSGRPELVRYLYWVPTSAPSVSSSQIREHAAKTGQLLEGSVSLNVRLYLMGKRLYGIHPSAHER